MSTTVLQPQQKPSLILIHGFRGAPVGLRKIATMLENAGYDVHTPAIPPFAGAKLTSRSDDTKYDAKHYADFLKDYIRQHNLNRPVLIGHSMGSIVVAATAQIHPELIHHKIILLSPIAKRPAPPFRLVSPLAAYLSPDLVDRITTRFLFVPHNRALYREALEITHQCSSASFPSRPDLIAATKFSLQNAVSDFTIMQKTLIIAGEHDRLVPQRQTRALASQLQAKLQLIPNAGHLHNYEAPERTAELILDFLD